MKRVTFEEFLVRARRTHGDTYEYPEQVLEGGERGTVRVICREHGEFVTGAKNHSSKTGCPHCGRLKITGRPGKTFEDYKRQGETHHAQAVEALEMLPGGYLRLSCSTHGEFTQQASDHAAGHGCRKCASSGGSRLQAELTTYCRLLGEPMEVDYTFAGRKELDVFFPRLKLGIELDGIYWHSTARADRLNIARKHALAKQNGIKIISVFEDEWLHRPQAVMSLLKYSLGVQERMDARKCSLGWVNQEEAREFYEDTHIQGAPGDCSMTAGLFHAGRLVMAMSFTRVNSFRGHKRAGKSLELRRMASSVCVRGGASRLWKFTLDALKPDFVVSYSDIRMFGGGVYEKLGFKRAGVSRPDYQYVLTGERFRQHKANFTRARLRKVVGFDPAKSEAENMANLGWHRIYDCGKVRWEWCV